MRELLRRLFRRSLTVHDCTCLAGTFDGLRQYRTDPGGAHLSRCPYARFSQPVEDK